MRPSVALPAMLLGSAVALGCGAPRPEASPPEPAHQLRFVAEPGRPEASTVEVVGLAPATLKRLRREPAEALARRLVIFTAEAAQHPDRPAVAGEVSVEPDRVRFRPRFPFVPGQGYMVRWLGDGGDARALELPAVEIPALEIRFALPRPAPVASTVVAEVFPTAAELPENLLKLYVHFSAPMSRGEARQRLHLLNDDGSEVEAAFALPGVELWDGETRRLTVLLDPGRIKRGVGPNEELGPPLVAGRGYRLRIDREWADAQGDPLAAAFEKRFRAVAPDRSAPRPADWRLEPPATPAAPLAIFFPEPLDRALLDDSLAVLDAGGSPVAGTVEVTDGETAWRFSPREPWRPGAYRVRVDPRLEDLSGNSVRRPFETPVGAEAGEQEPAPGSVELLFRVAGSPERR